MKSDINSHIDAHMSLSVPNLVAFRYFCFPLEICMRRGDAGARGPQEGEREAEVIRPVPRVFI
jgi:hypothetical protein